MLSNHLSLRYGNLLEQASRELEREIIPKEEANGLGSQGRALLQVKFLLYSKNDFIMLTP
jgi:hypothetical protein